jgi:hypothetical protein
MGKNRWPAMTVKECVVVLCSALASCGAGSVAADSAAIQLGAVPIGAVPRDRGFFASTDCWERQPLFADCSARDKDGIKYVFFSGALSKVSASVKEVGPKTRLPGNIAFGESIDVAGKKIEAAAHVMLKRGLSPTGAVILTSEFSVTSSAGVPFSIVLIADDKGRLAEVIERTDF